MPDFAANPIKKKTKAIKTIPLSRPAASSTISVHRRLPTPVLFLTASKRKIIPMNEKSIEVEQIKMYFSDASIVALSARIAMSTAERTVVSSTQIKNKARLCVKIVMVVAASRNENLKLNIR